MPVIQTCLVEQQLEDHASSNEKDDWAVNHSTKVNPYQKYQVSDEQYDEIVEGKKWCLNSIVGNSGTVEITLDEMATLRTSCFGLDWENPIRKSKVHLLMEIWRKVLKTEMHLADYISSNGLRAVIYYARVKTCANDCEDFTMLKLMSESDIKWLLLEGKHKYHNRLTWQFRVKLPVYERPLCGECKQENIRATLHGTIGPGLMTKNFIFIFDNHVRSVCPSPKCIASFWRKDHKTEVKRFGEGRIVHCGYCSKELTTDPILKCGRCRAVEYCSRKCQKVYTSI